MILLTCFLAFFLITCSSGGGGSGSDSGGSTSSGSYSISGQVHGVISNDVTIKLTGKTTAFTTTDTSGNYSFNDLANRTYTVTPYLKGYTFSPTSSQVTVNGDNVYGINFQATFEINVSIVPNHLDIDIPWNAPQTFTITNTAPGESKEMKFTVTDNGALGGFLNLQIIGEPLTNEGRSVTGSLGAGASAMINVSVRPEFVSGAYDYITGQYDIAPVGATLGLSVYTPDAANYKESAVMVDIINPQLTVQSQNCTILSTEPDAFGNVQILLEVSGTAKAATGDELWCDHVDEIPQTFTCVSWTKGDGLARCTRMPGDPVTTQWFLKVYGFTGVSYTQTRIVLCNGGKGATPPEVTDTTECIPVYLDVPCY